MPEGIGKHLPPHHPNWAVAMWLNYLVGWRWRLQQRDQYQVTDAL